MRVSVGSSGKPFRIVVVDRIAIAAKGDYSFVIPAPVEDVRAVAGSDSEPGLRSGSVVWQGFSPGGRRLSAAVTLHAAAAAVDLPLRVEIDGSQLRLVNTTSASATVMDANVSAVDIARALDAARAAVELGIPTSTQLVNAVGAVREARTTDRVPLRVRGTIRFSDGAPRKLEDVVGQSPIEIVGNGRLKALELSVSVPEPASLLRPPGADRWLDLARSGRLPTGRKATRLAASRLLTAALALQFQEFLANPDMNGAARSSYRYLLAERRQAAPVDASGRNFGWPAAVAIALGLIGAAVAGLVLWAHS